MKSETRQCQNCKKDFTIETEDFNFYEKIGVPAPKFCPECRLIRRLAWRNDLTFYNRSCDLCGEKIISIEEKGSALILNCGKCGEKITSKRKNDTDI